MPIYGALAATAGMSGIMPTAKEIKEKFTSLKEAIEKINNTGVGILMKYKK